MSKYIFQADLENALSVPTVLAIFDDGSGTVNASAINAVIDRAEAEVDSYLPSNYPAGTPAPSDRLLKHAALEFAVCFSMEKHPEYVRNFGEEPRTNPRYTRARQLMQRIVDGVQRLPDTPTKPRNVGGVVYSAGPRTIIDNIDGSSNLGDF
jgi:hypothetical protein